MNWFTKSPMDTQSLDSQTASYILTDENSFYHRLTPWRRGSWKIKSICLDASLLILRRINVVCSCLKSLSNYDIGSITAYCCRAHKIRSTLYSQGKLQFTLKVTRLAHCEV